MCGCSILSLASGVWTAQHVRESLTHQLPSDFTRMARSTAKSIQELETQKKAIKEAAAAEVAAIRKATAEKVAAYKASSRRLRALDIREQKGRQNHAKILVGELLFEIAVPCGFHLHSGLFSLWLEC